MKSRDENIEKLVEKMMMESPIETPSFDFTSKVMSDVLCLERKKSFSYKPVISKRGWFIIFACIGGFITWFIFNGYAEKETATNIDFNFINAERILNVFSAFQPSSLSLYVTLLAMVMIFIQILFLRNYLHKRFERK